MTQPPQQPDPFSPYSQRKDKVDHNAPTRRIDSPNQRPDDEPSPSVMESAKWRADRRRPVTTPTAGSGRMAVATQQRVTSWLSAGGWKYMAAAAVALLLLLIFLLAQNKPDATNPVATRPTLTTGSGLNNPNATTAPIVIAPNAGATQAPTVPDQGQPPASTGARFAVAGTGTDGLFLRDQPGGTALKTLPEGSPVEKLGEQDVGGVLWFNIREAGGLEGWSSSQFLVAAP